MRRALYALALLPALAGGLALAQAAYTPGPQNISLPAGWQDNFIRYAIVDRPDRKIVRHLYVNPEAFAAARPGQPLPDRTLILMVNYNARLDAAGNPLLDQHGRFIPQTTILSVEAQERRPGWGEGYGPEKRNGEWEYARFAADGSRMAGPVEACFTCHLRTRAQQDFAFNFWDYVQARK
jgi:hypothetical protein